MLFDECYDLTIDGKGIQTSGRIEVINPATGLVFAGAPSAGARELDLAVGAARTAFPDWRRLSREDRQRHLDALASAIDENLDGFAALFLREQGRPAPQARREVQAGSDWLRAVAKLDIPIEIAEDTDTRRVEVHRHPLGVVCGIVPWNFPFLLAMWKIAPALLTGNTMVIKPSPFTPLCLLKLGELSRRILPPGVLNVISGDDALGPLMTAHPGFAKISFTGSTATGKRVMAAAARDLKRVTLELGGNDAAIVLPDVDPDRIASQLFSGAFFNNAQVCIATKRMYIHADIYDAVRDRLHALAKAAVMGDGKEPGVMFGPIQNAPQYRRVMDLIDHARAEGLTLLEGGAVPAEGYFVPITLIDNPPDDSRVVVEEAFGPVLPLLKFNHLDEVVQRANTSDFGLAGAVWSDNVEQAIDVALRLETGTVWINQNLATGPHIPFAGAKQSGMGVENGREGLLEYTQAKSIYIPKPAPQHPQ